MPYDPELQPTRAGVEILPVMGSAAPLGQGQVLGSYRIEHELGRGGMGVVYRAEHVHLDRTVALKVLPPELTTDAAFRERFLRESRLAASLDHPAIVAVYDAGEARGILYLAMRFIEGRDLAEVLERGPLEPERAVDVVAQVAAGLDAAHEAGLVHRDVKPANILTDGRRCWLTDFGLAKRSAGRTGLTGLGQMVGTVDYLAPEQIEGGPVDGRADVYALGCVLFHALAGRPPYRRESDVQTVFAHVQQPPPALSEVRPGVPAGLDGVIARAMAKSPGRRFQTCGELAAAAREAVAPAETGSSSAAAVVAVTSGATRALVRATLGGLGIEVIEADADGDLVERVQQASAPLLVIEAGPAAAGTVERVKATPARPLVIGLGPRTDSSALQALRDGGADEIVSVPFSSMQLQVAIGELLEGSRAQQRGIS